MYRIARIARCSQRSRAFVSERLESSHCFSRYSCALSANAPTENWSSGPPVHIIYMRHVSVNCGGSSAHQRMIMAGYIPFTGMAFDSAHLVGNIPSVILALSMMSIIFSTFTNFSVNSMFVNKGHTYLLVILSPTC